MSEYAIETNELQRDFKAIHAVHKLTLAITAGSIFGFLGPNGAGKTTTIRLLLGLLEPSAGDARVLGFDIRTQAAAIRQECGALLEHHGLYERMSAEENLDYYGRIWHIPTQERHQRIQSLLEKVGLWDRRKETVIGWSRGMKQKLAVARAIFHHPRLLFLDEPTAGLDPVAAASLRDDLSMLVEQEGVTVFLTTHNLLEAEKLCHQIGVIRQGQLVALDSPEALKNRSGASRVEVHGENFSEKLLMELRAHPEVKSTSMRNGSLWIELTSQVSIAPIVTQMVTSGAVIEEVRRDKASLEDVFLTLMEEEK